ncbi:uncharacterized protein LOC122859890 [Aphidius gifuensis]|uniref:uncharacterized protein LOC122859890 n=1 Tax=Aphidius gifuensis TaxID=684658 RepID=UPI001CDC4621|nr:uncharacterized protein LOC122859890 [Aphidius gifuensis]
MEEAYKTIRTPEQIESWFKFEKKNIRLLNKALKIGKTIGDKLRIQTTISQLRSSSERFKSQQKHGAGVGYIKKLNFQEKDSGWTLRAIINLMVNINRYEPLRGGLSTFIELPKKIQAKRAVVNIKNNDEYCFLYAVTAALYPTQSHSYRMTSYPDFKTILKYDGIDFPIILRDIPKFEIMNDLSINVYDIYDKCEIAPVYLSKHKSSKPTIHLLIMNSGLSTDEPIFHFACIQNLSRLVTDCENNNKVRMILPEEGENILKCKNHRFEEPAPFVIYADLECILEPGKNDSDNHVPHSAAYYFHCTYNKSLSEFMIRRGPDCIKWFVKELKKRTQQVNDILNNPTPMKPLTREQIMDFQTAQICHICEKEFLPTDIRHHDHCHYRGHYRGAAHPGCNVNYTDSHTLPVVFHNLSGYDSHFFLKSLAKMFEGSIRILPINKEKYISFTKEVKYPCSNERGNRLVNLRFIDSYRFMATSLDKLASNLSDDDKKITKQYCEDFEKFQLLKRKEIFPYEYINSWRRLEDIKLPSINEFYSRLSKSIISHDDYQHAETVWNKFEIKTLGDYSDLYLRTDVLLLADIFQNFRKNCLSSYNLDPLYCYTIPGFSWDCMLKCTGVELELLTDAEQLLFIEKGIRGGVAVCPNRYAKANNPYMGNEYDTIKDDSYLMYFDVDNLYGMAMSQHFPYGGFEWDNNHWSLEDILSTPVDSTTGFIYEVDLEYPEKLHELHQDLPFTDFIAAVTSFPVFDFIGIAHANFENMSIIVSKYL